jgi:hypothetical protein
MAIGSETQKEISSLQLQIGKCLAKGYKTQAKPLIKRINEIKDRKGGRLDK